MSATPPESGLSAASDAFALDARADQEFLVLTVAASLIATLGLLANSAGLLGLGVQPANTPVLGLQLLVDPAGLALLTAPISAGGAAAWPFAVPGTPALDNVVLYAQAFGLDGGAPGGLLSASAGLRVRLCVSAP